jgi:hypothetical protein
MANESVAGDRWRGHVQGTGSVEKILDSLTFADDTGPHVSRQHLPCTAEPVEGVVYMLERLDKLFRGGFAFFPFAYHRRFLRSREAPAAREQRLGPTNVRTPIRALQVLQPREAPPAFDRDGNEPLCSTNRRSSPQQ